MALMRSPGVTRRVALAPDDSGRCPDFPPALRLATFGQRSPGSPAVDILPDGGGPLPIFSKDVIVGELEQDTVQGFDSKMVSLAGGSRTNG